MKNKLNKKRNKKDININRGKRAAIGFMIVTHFLIFFKKLNILLEKI